MIFSFWMDQTYRRDQDRFKFDGETSIVVDGKIGIMI